MQSILCWPFVSLAFTTWTKGPYSKSCERSRVSCLSMLTVIQNRTRELVQQYVLIFDFCFLFFLIWLLAGFQHCATSEWSLSSNEIYGDAERCRIQEQPQELAKTILSPLIQRTFTSITQGRQDQAHHGGTGEHGTIDPMEMFSTGGEPFGWWRLFIAMDHGDAIATSFLEFSILLLKRLRIRIAALRQSVPQRSLHQNNLDWRAGWLWCPKDPPKSYFVNFCSLVYATISKVLTCRLARVLSAGYLFHTEPLWLSRHLSTISAGAAPRWLWIYTSFRQ